MNSKSNSPTGGSSGIGLAMVKLLLHHGATVVSGDMNASPVDDPNHTFQTTDVTKWPDLVSLFKLAKSKHGRIDHVHANAGISGRANYIGDEFDEHGELKEPSTLTYGKPPAGCIRCLSLLAALLSQRTRPPRPPDHHRQPSTTNTSHPDINLRGSVNTAYLGVHHMRHQSPPGGSIVLTASASSFQQFRVTDYTTAKHGVLGWMRGMVPLLTSAALPIRVNCIGPSWTVTGLVPQALVDALGGQSQGPEIAARSAAILMADARRQGNFVYSWEGRFMEIERARFLPVAAELMGSAGDTGEEEEQRGERKNVHDIEKLFEQHGVQPAAFGQ